MPKLCNGLRHRREGRADFWMHENIPQQQRWQLREGFLYQYQSFAQLSSFTACKHQASQSCSIIRE